VRMYCRVASLPASVAKVSPQGPIGARLGLVAPAGLRGPGEHGVLVRVGERYLHRRVVVEVSRSVPFEHADRRRHVGRLRVALAAGRLAVGNLCNEKVRKSQEAGKASQDCQASRQRLRPDSEPTTSAGTKLEGDIWGLFRYSDFGPRPRIELKTVRSPQKGRPRYCGGAKLRLVSP
jgi:hypothetical protein